jgi:hypothetical protein
MMHAREKSDSAIVAGKPTNKAERSATEPVEAETKGKCEPAKHAPDAESGKCDPGAGTRTESSKQKEEGEVHRAPPSHQRRTSRSGVQEKPRTSRMRESRSYGSVRGALSNERPANASHARSGATRGDIDTGEIDQAAL